jgi:F-type H+-transporting ATPase subunit c
MIQLLALAQAPAPAAPAGSDLTGAFLALAIGLGMAIAVFGGAFGQGRAISASVEATARQPEAGGRIFLSMILGLGFIESLVLFALYVLGFTLDPHLTKLLGG